MVEPRYENYYFDYLESQADAERHNIRSQAICQGEATTKDQRLEISSVGLYRRLRMARTLRGKKPSQAKPARPAIVVFGPPGVGKTWTSLDFPNAYYIDVEGGANLPHYTAKLEAVDASYLGPEDGASDFDVVLEEIQSLATTDHDRKTLIIDSFSKLFNNDVQLEHDRLTSAGKGTDFGSDKKPAIAKMRRMVKWLSKLDMNVLLICHEKAKWSGGEQVGTEADAHQELTYDLNLVVQIVKQGKSRKARVVKSRFSTFAENELVDWTYDEFAERLGRHNLEAEFVAKDVASSEQCARMRELVDSLPITAATVQKMFDKAGVSRWEEMTAEEIAKAIVFYERKAG